MRIGLAQLNTTVGDLAGNRRLILDAYKTLVAQGAELVVYPELVICGYPPRDLLFKRRFVPDIEATLAEIAAEIGNIPALIGTVETNPAENGRRFYNAAAFCQNGRIISHARKCLLPTYDVFDEDRYFEPASTPPSVIEVNGKKVGITICEDIWTHPELAPRNLYHFQPLDWLAGQQLDLMVNLSASPWHHGKGYLRTQLVTDAARELGCPVVYVNAVGGNDELVFDGRSIVADATGKITTTLVAFESAVRIAEVPVGHVPNQSPRPLIKTSSERASAASPTSPSSASSVSAALSKQSDIVNTAELGDIYRALVLGLRDYGHKSGFKKALIALSGGIDSALVAVLAVEAFGAENVIGISLPSAISSQHSRDDARELARNLGIRFETIAIADTVGAAEASLRAIFNGLKRDVTEENIQARVRGVVMMALSNKFGSLLLTTGNKSEVAVGYCTLYGDMCGGLAVISDVFKTQVYALCRWINSDLAAQKGVRELIPLNTIEKPPSAELRPDQVDQDTLPPYDILDALLHGYVEEGLSRRDLVAQGFDESVVHDIVRKVDLNEYKRKQMAPGLKITPLAFGVGRRIPIVQRYIS